MRGKDNGIFTVTLNDEWELMIAILFDLSAKSGIAGVEVEYLVVKDFCKEYELDSINTFSLLKKIALAVFKK